MESLKGHSLALSYMPFATRIKVERPCYLFADDIKIVKTSFDQNGPLGFFLIFFNGALTEPGHLQSESETRKNMNAELKFTAFFLARRDHLWKI